MKNDGTLWAWGGNGNGVLGQNNVVARSSPTQITGEWNPADLTATQATAFAFQYG